MPMAAHASGIGRSASGALCASSSMPNVKSVVGQGTPNVGAAPHCPGSAAAGDCDHSPHAPAVTDQLGRMSHIMFGGLTHEPAARLAQLLVEITPAGLDTVFFSDSGSVSVEVAVKMALQYWRNRGDHARTKFVAFRGAYHGDTTGAMAVSDIDAGMRLGCVPHGSPGSGGSNGLDTTAAIGRTAICSRMS